MEYFNNLSDLYAKYSKQGLLSKFVVQRDVDHVYCVYKNFSSFMENYAKTDNLHEVIFSNQPRKFVVDIETKVDYDGHERYLELYESHVDRIKILLKKLFCVIYIRIIPSDDIIVITSSGKYDENKFKFSVNLVIDHHYFANYAEFKYFGNRLCEEYYKHEDAIPKFIDDGFYRRSDLGKIFTIRIPGHSKCGEIRPKKVEPHINIKHAFVSYIDNCTKLKKIVDPELTKKKYKPVSINNTDEEILKLTEHIWNPGFVFRNRDDNVFYFNRIEPSYCKFCNEVHHVDNQLYIVYFNGALWEKCFHARDSPGKFIIALEDGTRVKKEPVEYVPAKLNIDSPTLESSKMFPPNKSIYLIKAQMKMGKTEECIKYIKNNNIATSIIISFRRTFANSMKSRYENFVLYSSIIGPINIDQHQKIIIQLESLNRIQYPLPEIDLLILDEIESIWSQFNHSQINDYHGIVSTFKNIIMRSKKIICMDADLSGRTKRLLELIRPDYAQNHNIYVNNHNPDPTTKYTFVDDQKMMIALIMKKLELGKKVVIATNSIKLSEELFALITTKFNKIKVGIYNSKTKESKKNKHFNDVNHHWSKYDCLIYSPTVTSGVSFTTHHFHIMFGLFVSESCNVETCKQMMGRVREIIDKNIYINVTDLIDTPREYSVDPDEIRTMMKIKRDELMTYASQKYNLELLQFEYDFDGNAEYHNSLPYYIISENIAYDNKSKNKFKYIFVRYLRQAGFFVVINADNSTLGLTMDEINNTKRDLALATEKHHTNQADLIIEAKDITPVEFYNIKDKSKQGVDVTKEEQLEITKYKMKKILRVDLTHKVTKIFKPNGSGHSIPMKHYMSCKELFEIAAKDRIRDDYYTRYNTMCNKNYAKDATSSYRSIAHEILLVIFNIVHFTQNLTGIMLSKAKFEYNLGLIVGNASTTSEYNSKICKYWSDPVLGSQGELGESRLSQYRGLVKKCIHFNNLSIDPNIDKMNQDDLFPELVTILQKVYGVRILGGVYYGSPNIQFSHQGNYYIGGKMRKYNPDIPVITIPE